MSDDDTGVPLHPGIRLSELAAESASIPDLNTGLPTGWRCRSLLEASIGGEHLVNFLYAWSRGEAELDELKATRVFKHGLCDHLRIAPAYLDQLLSEWDAYRRQKQGEFVPLSHAAKVARARNAAQQRREIDQQKRAQHQQEIAEWMQRHRPARELQKA
jgi:hypothetical protein